jgi:hypothetical protein
MTRAALCNASAIGSKPSGGSVIRRHPSCTRGARSEINFGEWGMKRRILLLSLLATTFLFGGRWVTRTEPSEEVRPIGVKEAMSVVVEPPSVASILQPLQPQGASSSSRQIIPFNPAIASAAWRSRAAQYEPLFNSAALRHGVDARWLWIIAYLETRFRPELVSPKGARGLMQFTDATAERYDLVDPHDAAASIDAAARYVRDLSMRFGNRLDLILAGYNAGEGAVDAYLKGYALRLPNGRVINPQGLKLGGIPPYEETRNYVANGLSLARLLSVPDFPALSTYSPSKRRPRGSASVAGIFAPKRAATRPQPPAEESATPTLSEPVIRSIRVTIPAVASGTR